MSLKKPEYVRTGGLERVKWMGISHEVAGEKGVEEMSILTSSIDQGPASDGHDASCGSNDTRVC